MAQKLKRASGTSELVIAATVWIYQAMDETGRIV